ncbi:MAG: cellulase family glycosylhydrolase [Eubacterium sp.]|nr:cellulase family glycosylhydrolase [Eubacterium sp.]
MKKFNGFERGINLGGWLSQCDYTKETYENYVKADDLKQIAAWGLDHVRVPVDYNLIEDEAGNDIEEGYGYIDRVVGWCRDNGLNMLLDLHKTYGYSFDFGEDEEGFFDNADYQERFYKLWEKLASRYGKYNDMIAFELLNEITDREYMEKWNRITNTCIERIRAIAPTTYILTSGYYNSSIESLPALDPPHDEYIVYTFHCYEPLIFTHQGAYWAPGMSTDFRMSIDEPYRVMKENSKKYLSQVTVGFADFDPEERFGVPYFDKFFSEAVKIAEERNVALYCGEYGVIDRADPQEILKWYKIINSAFEKYGIARCAWNYRGKDFGFVDDYMKPVIGEIVKYL